MSGTNWSNPTLTSTYVNQQSDMKARDVSAMTQMRSSLTADTNVPTGAVRWNDTTFLWESWNGTAWVALANTYGISISGNAGSASAVAWGGITGKPTTVSGYGIADINSYAPTLTGGGASGNWGISITGVAASASAVPWTGVTSKPTTLTGYGITDAAPLNSPALTGTPTAPTPAMGDNSTKIATTAFVKANSGGGGHRIFDLRAGTSYTPAADVKEFYVFVYGATGGVNTTNYGGFGGRGYSEKHYPNPSGTYSYTIGATPAIGTAAAGGDTTFDTITVTGGAAVTSNNGAAGGVGSGGDFNATGGTGGNGYGTGNVRGGAGGAASRAGNGGNGGNYSVSTSGGGGGTGGNNASGTTGGIAATSADIGAIALPTFLIGFTEVFSAGVNGSTSTKEDGGRGALAVSEDLESHYGLTVPIYTKSTTYSTYQNRMNGQITIVEILK